MGHLTKPLFGDPQGTGEKYTASTLDADIDVQWFPLDSTEGVCIQLFIDNDGDNAVGTFSFWFSNDYFNTGTNKKKVALADDEGNTTQAVASGTDYDTFHSFSSYNAKFFGISYARTSGSCTDAWGIVRKVG